MRLDMGGVDRPSPTPDAALPCQSLEDREPDTLLAPAVVAIVDRRVGSVGHRAVAPAGPGSQHMDDPADHPTIIHPMRSTPALRQQRLDLRPTSVVQPIKMLHQAVLPNTLNHIQTSTGIPIEYGP